VHIKNGTNLTEKAALTFVSANLPNVAVGVLQLVEILHIRLVGLDLQKDVSIAVVETGAVLILVGVDATAAPHVAQTAAQHRLVAALPVVIALVRDDRRRVALGLLDLALGAGLARFAGPGLHALSDAGVDPTFIGGRRAHIGVAGSSIDPVNVAVVQLVIQSNWLQIRLRYVSSNTCDDVISHSISLLIKASLPAISYRSVDVRIATAFLSKTLLHISFHLIPLTICD